MQAEKLLNTKNTEHAARFSAVASAVASSFSSFSHLLPAATSRTVYAARCVAAGSSRRTQKPSAFFTLRHYGGNARDHQSHACKLHEDEVTGREKDKQVHSKGRQLRGKTREVREKRNEQTI